jgi:predicted porin
MLDDAGIGSDYQFGINSFFSNGSPFGADESVRYDIDKGNFYGGVAYKQDKNKNAGLGEDGHMVDAKVGARVADFDFTGFYGQADFKGAGADVSDLPLVTGEGKETFWALEGRWSGVENLNLALGYYNIKLDPKATEALTQQTYGLAADYTIGKVIIAAGVSQSDYDKALAVSSTSTDTWDKQTNWYLNAGYALAPGATAYVEVGANDGRTYAVDSTNSTFTSTKNGTGVAVGIKAAF